MDWERSREGSYPSLFSLSCLLQCLRDTEDEMANGGMGIYFPLAAVFIGKSSTRRFNAARKDVSQR